MPGSSSRWASTARDGEDNGQSKAIQASPSRSRADGRVMEQSSGYLGRAIGEGRSVEPHLLVERDGLGVLGLGDLAAPLIDDRERRVAEDVVGLDLDDLLGVLDCLLALGEVDIELGEHAVRDREL